MDAESRSLRMVTCRASPRKGTRNWYSRPGRESDITALVT